MNSHHLVPALCALLLGAGAAHAQDARPAPNPAAVTVPADLALPASAAALKAALALELAGAPEAERTAIDGFFAARAYAPFWTEPGSDRAEALIAALEASGAQGLPSARYDPAALAALFGSAGRRRGRRARGRRPPAPISASPATSARASSSPRRSTRTSPAIPIGRRPRR